MTDYERIGDYQPSETGNRIGTALTFLFIGLGVGAITALLVAPKTGRQMRRALRRQYEDAREVIGDWSETAGDIARRGADWAETAKEKIQPLGKRIRIK